MKMIDAFTAQNRHFPEGYTVIFDRKPVEDFKFYEAKLNSESTLYWGVNSQGFVEFYAHSPFREHGFGGRSFVLNMADGTTKTIKGPWSSRPGIMNNFFPPCMEVKYRDKLGREASHHAMVATILKSINKDFLDALDIPGNDELVAEAIEERNELTFRLVPKTFRDKQNAYFTAEDVL